jgi:hypothetical protein
MAQRRQSRSPDVRAVYGREVDVLAPIIRLTSDVEKVTGTPPLSVYDFVLRHADLYTAANQGPGIMKRIGWSLGLIMLATSAVARDDGRYADSPLKAWFESLSSDFGSCCSDADGYFVADVDWESDRGHYRVRIDNEWVAVPDGAVITEPNKAGRTIVWKHYIDGHPPVRCFMRDTMM